MTVPTFKRAAISAILAFAFPSLSVAQTAPRSCVSNDEAEALTIYVLPTAVRAVSGRCAQWLPATSALVQAGAVSAARYQIDADRAWPAASRAVDKISGVPASKMITEQTLKPFVDKVVTDIVTRKLKPKDCERVDRLINILQPMPAKNLAMLVVLALESTGSKSGNSLPLPLCSVQPAAPAKGNASK